MIISLSMARFLPTLLDLAGGYVPPVAAHLSGGAGGYVLPGETLTGWISGLGAGQSVIHRWLADDVEIAGETASTLVPEPGVNVPSEAVLIYAPLVDGVEHLSGSVRVTAPVIASVSGDTNGEVLPEQSLTGAVSGGRSGQEVTHNWLADGVEIAGEAAPVLVPVPGVNVPADAVLIYAPRVEGVTYASAPVQLVAPAAALVSGDTGGLALPAQTLTGAVQGGLSGQLVEPGWTANDALLPSETETVLTPEPGVNVPAEALVCYTPRVDGEIIVSPPVQLVPAPQAVVTGDTNGFVLPDQSLSGSVTGGIPGQEIVHRWLANGAEIAGEVTSTLVPEPGVNVSPEAVLVYAPLVGGVALPSAPVQLVAGAMASVSGDTDGEVLPGQTLTGSVMGGVPGQTVTHRWLADGTEIAGEAAPALVVAPGVDVPIDAVLVYAPMIDGAEHFSAPIQLRPAIEVALSGDQSGYILPNQTLTGAVSGGLTNQSVVQRWLADGAEVVNEMEETLLVQPGVNVPSDAALTYAPLIDGTAYASAAVQLVTDAMASVSGDTDGEVLPGQTLTGHVTGGIPGQVITHRWRADGVELQGEMQPIFVPEPGVNVSEAAVVEYAPLVGGSLRLSMPVQLRSAPTATLAGDQGGYVLPGTLLTGGVTGGLTGQTILHRWTADGVEIAGETQASLTASPGGSVGIEAALRYAPMVDGVVLMSPVVQLVAEVTVSVSGDTNGSIEPQQTLTGAVSGGIPGQSVTHRWLANGSEIQGETGPSFTPDPGVNVPAEAQLHYAPLVDGTAYLSSAVQLSPATQPQALPRLVGQQRMGAEIALDASMLTGVSGRTYYLDGVEIEGATGPTVIAMGMGALTCEVVANEGSFTTPALQILHNHAMDSHNTADDAVLAIMDHGMATHIAVADGDWSNAAIWDVGSVPGLGDAVLVPAGRAVRYDIAAAPPRLSNLRIDGTLSWALDQSTAMLVETIIVSPSGHMVIGASAEQRLPPAYSAEITISNRAFHIDADNPTDLDLARDPTLHARGVLWLGAVTVFGHHREHAVTTAPGSLPLAGATSVTLEHAPQNWGVGDTILIPGTAVDLDAAGVNTRYDEERVITAIAGAVVSFDTPLLHNHDHHNPAVTDRPDLVLPIIVKDRNVTIRSEAGAAIHQRGHCMAMHRAARVDIWDMAFIELGRTDKSHGSGIIKDGQFYYIPSGTKTPVYAPLTAQSNLQSRYPIHGHFLGFGKDFTDLVRDCFVEGAPAWAGVHHGCEMDWINNAFYRFQGAGLVSETGDELGRWDNNLVCGLETTTGAYRYPKGQEEKEGKAGDTFKWGYGFAYRGRAMIVTRNVAIGATWGHVFYHRHDANGIGDIIDHYRQDVDVNDLNIYNGHDQIGRHDYPITHFDNCCAIGCSGAVAVVKAAAAQGHDLNIKIANFLGWAVGRGIHLNYIGGYLVQDVDCIRSEFDAQTTYAPGLSNAGYTMGKTNQVAWDRVKARGWAVAIEFSGADVQGISNNNFSQADPRFMLGSYSFLASDGTALPDATAITYYAGNETATEDVTRIMPQPVTYMDRPQISIDWPAEVPGRPDADRDFFVGLFDNDARIMTEGAVATKTDTVSNGGKIPKAWDGAGLSFGNTPHILMRGYAERHGLWDYTDSQGTTHKVLLIPYYWSDRFTAVSIKTMQAVIWLGNTGSYRQNGPWSRATGGFAADLQITRQVTQNVEDKFNAITEANVSGAGPFTLNIPELVPGLGLDKPAYFKANYGDIAVSSDGMVSYTPVLNYTGEDRMLVYAYDGQGQFRTVEILYDIHPA